MDDNAIPRLPFGGGALVETRIYDHTLRTPAAPLAERWPITRALELGARVAMISASIAAGGCALVALVTSAVPPKTATVATAAAAIDPARVMLEDFRAKVAGGATFHTASGDL